MLNKSGLRELAYVVKVDEVKPIEGRDRVECAVVGGWTIMVRKGDFEPDDLGIYFEIDSQVPASESFSFLEKYHYRIKTQKFKTPSGQFWSQGLLMTPKDFGWEVEFNMARNRWVIVTDSGETLDVEDESRFVTERLGVTFAMAEPDSGVKSVDKYKKMAQRNSKLFAKQPFRFMMRYTWGRKFLFLFFGNKKDKKNAWPEWVEKTDEERVQNMPWILQDKSEWIATEKIDGTSTTFTMKRGKRGKYEFYICSRNVVFDKPDKQCFYENNVYVEMAEMYHIEAALHKILEDNPQYQWVTLQGETYGMGIQNREYGMTGLHNSLPNCSGHNFAGFNFITSADGRWNSIKAADYLLEFGIPWVPIIDSHFILPDTVDELLAIATDQSMLDNGPREGIVLRSIDGTKSFKAVSNEFLMEFHRG